MEKSMEDCRNQEVFCETASPSNGCINKNKPQNHWTCNMEKGNFLLLNKEHQATTGCWEDGLTSPRDESSLAVLYRMVSLKSHACLSQKHAAGCIHMYVCARTQTHTHTHSHLTIITKVKEAINSGDMRGAWGWLQEAGERKGEKWCHSISI